MDIEYSNYLLELSDFAIGGEVLAILAFIDLLQQKSCLSGHYAGQIDELYTHLRWIADEVYHRPNFDPTYKRL